jgi:hypothetical protein
MADTAYRLASTSTNGNRVDETDVAVGNPPVVVAVGNPPVVAIGNPPLVAVGNPPSASMYRGQVHFVFQQRARKGFGRGRFSGANGYETLLESNPRFWGVCYGDLSLAVMEAATSFMHDGGRFRFHGINGDLSNGMVLDKKGIIFKRLLQAAGCRLCRRRKHAKEQGILEQGTFRRRPWPPERRQVRGRTSAAASSAPEVPLILPTVAAPAEHDADTTVATEAPIALRASTNAGGPSNPYVLSRDIKTQMMEML